MAKNQGNFIGSWAFLIGVILAVILGILGTISTTMMIVLVVIGLVVGFLNIADKEVQPFLMSGVVLIIASAFGQGVFTGLPTLSNILDALLAVFVPATIIVALKNVFTLARR